MTTRVCVCVSFNFYDKHMQLSKCEFEGYYSTKKEFV